MKNSVYNKLRAVPEDVWFYDTDGLISEKKYGKMHKRIVRNSQSRVRSKKMLERGLGEDWGD